MLFQIFHLFVCLLVVLYSNFISAINFFALIKLPFSIAIVYDKFYFNFGVYIILWVYKYIYIYRYYWVLALLLNGYVPVATGLLLIYFYFFYFCFTIVVIVGCRVPMQLLKCMAHSCIFISQSTFKLIFLIQTIFTSYIRYFFFFHCSCGWVVVDVPSGEYDSNKEQQNGGEIRCTVV